jgi:Major Facilitator Superfamily
VHVPRFRDYAASRIASGVAMALLQALILWQVYAISGSTLQLGLVGLVGFVAGVLSSLVGGVVVDTYDRRKILFASQVVPGLCSLGMLAAIATDHVSLGLIYGIVLVTGLATSFEFPARQAILPDVIPRKLFVQALTVNSAVNSISGVSGPALMGALVALSGVGLAYAVHGVLIVVAIVSLVPLHIPAKRDVTRMQLSAVRGGLAFVWRRPVLLGAMTLDMFAVMFGGARAMLPVYAVSILQVDALGYGLLSASLEAGTVIMAVILLALPPVRRMGLVLLLAVGVFGLATMVFGISRWLPLSILAYAVVGMADQVSMVLRQNVIQLSTPDALRGRVTAVNSVFISASNELGALESGLVASLTTPAFAVVSGGLGCLIVVALVAWCVPSLRHYRASDAGKV